ncbi:hypothetical protein CYMTET_44488 [Cymbomonas tetramitiformis]|uniref:Uncharacterized protein n=1 Tax=Cymbomonas tetramitiformis TaxID=36881 RepID=A0AAE0EYZ6_9CHLO|nr:hypothetical protein CYMTET_44488 [Cymbomonas tetramitiformis]
MSLAPPSSPSSTNDSSTLDLEKPLQHISDYDLAPPASLNFVSQAALPWYAVARAGLWLQAAAVLPLCPPPGGYLNGWPFPSVAALSPCSAVVFPSVAALSPCSAVAFRDFVGFSSVAALSPCSAVVFRDYVGFPSQFADHGLPTFAPHVMGFAAGGAPAASTGPEVLACNPDGAQCARAFPSEAPLGVLGKHGKRTSQAKRGWALAPWYVIYHVFIAGAWPLVMLWAGTLGLVLGVGGPTRGPVLEPFQSRALLAVTVVAARGGPRIDSSGRIGGLTNNL